MVDMDGLLADEGVVSDLFVRTIKSGLVSARRQFLRYRGHEVVAAAFEAERGATLPRALGLLMAVKKEGEPMPDASLAVEDTVCTIMGRVMELHLQIAQEPRTEVKTNTLREVLLLLLDETLGLAATAEPANVQGYCIFLAALAAICVDVIAPEAASRSFSNLLEIEGEADALMHFGAVLSGSNPVSYSEVKYQLAFLHQHKDRTCR